MDRVVVVSAVVVVVAMAEATVVVPGLVWMEMALVMVEGAIRGRNTCDANTIPEDEGGEGLGGDA